jgi:hypothetical protein
MLSTAQALQEWENVRKVLIDVRSHASAHPEDRIVPSNLLHRIDGSFVAVSRGPVSPQATWKLLLKQKLPYLVLMACTQLMATQQHAFSVPALCAAGMLVTDAAKALPPAAVVVAAASSNRSTSSSSTSSSSSNSKLTAMLWQQIEQSGVLQHLPAALSITTPELLDQIPDHPTKAHSCLAGSASEILSWRSFCLGNLLDGLQMLHPNFLSAHAVGQQCLAPAMQFGMSSLQYISSTLAQAGRQEWMGAWLSGAAFVANNGAVDAGKLLRNLLKQQDTANIPWDDASSSSSSGSSTAGQLREAALALLRAPQTMQWVYLHAVVSMMGQFLQQAAATAGTASTKTTISSSDPARVAANSPQPAAGSMSGEQWLPAALAHSMPTAYSCFLEQLGCSREAGLWLATKHNDTMGKLYPASAATKAAGKVSRQGGTPSVSRIACDFTLESPFQISVVLQAVEAFKASKLHPQLAAMHLSLSAACLQWLSDTPPRKLTGPTTPDASPGVYKIAAEACALGRRLLQLEDRHRPQPGQQEGDRWAEAMTASQVTMQLSAAALEKLLPPGHSLPDSAAVGTGGSSSSSSSRSSSTGRGSDNRNGNTLLETCKHLARTLATAYATAAEPSMSATATSRSAATPTQGNIPENTFSQQPVQRALCCKLLQGTVRLVGEAETPATIAAAATAAGPATTAGTTAAASRTIISTEDVGTTQMLEPVDFLLAGFKLSLDRTNTFPQAATTGAGPLAAAIAVIAAPGEVSSPDALQLFGLLCSLLKVYDRSQSSRRIAEVMARQNTVGSCGLWDVSTAVLAAASTVMKAAMASGPSGSSSSCSSTGGSSAVVAVLPWLLLLGRCCRACALLVQQWQGHPYLNGPANPGSYEPFLWVMYKSEVYKNLQQLQSSLACVVQWLLAAGTVQQLAALGYQPQDLQQQLAATTRAVAKLTTNLRAVDMCANDANPLTGINSAAGAVFTDIQKQLQAAGSVLAGFAIPHACNNPVCSNLCGPSEARLVGGRSCICAGCNTARYCGKTWQRAAWRQHKPVCKALAAAAAASAATGGLSG